MCACVCVYLSEWECLLTCTHSPLFFFFILSIYLRNYLYIYIYIYIY